MMEENGSTASDVPTNTDRTEEDGPPARDDRRAANDFGGRFQRSALLFLIGVPSLERLQEIIVKEAKEEEEETGRKSGKSWSELRNVLTDRANNNNVIAGLVIASCAIFLSTPPSTPHISWWNADFPYFCTLLSFGTAILVVISGYTGITCLALIGPADIKLARERIFTRAAFLVVLILPILLLHVSAISLGAAFIGALWFGDVFWMKVFLTIGYAGFIFIMFLIVLVLL